MVSNYLTVNQFEERLGVDDMAMYSADSGETANTSLVQSLIDEAEAHANSFLQGQVTIPVTVEDFPNTFARLTGITFDLARVKLAERRRPVPDDWKRAAEMAEKWLMDVRDGNQRLPDDGAESADFEWGSNEINASRDNIL